MPTDDDNDGGRNGTGVDCRRGGNFGGVNESNVLCGFGGARSITTGVDIFARNPVYSLTCTWR